MLDLTQYNINTEELKTQIESILKYSEMCVNDTVNFEQLQINNVEEMLSRWKENKQQFLAAWGKPIIECGEVEWGISPEVKEKRVFEFADFVQSVYMLNDLSDFIFDNKANFFENITLNDYEFYSYTKHKNIVIKKGSKIIKSFKYFIDDEDTLRRVQDKASEFLQQDKVKGTLCFSVHPLDFLSISENTYNWRSCHALDGEYRIGNLSYMCDPSTFICYIKGEGLQKLPRFPSDILWNSKKWRMLLYLSDDNNLLFAGRQYPFNTNEGLKHIMHYINNLSIIKVSSNICKYEPWRNDLITTADGYEDLEKHIITRNIIMPLMSVIQDQSNYHFNDLLYSHYYSPFYAQRNGGFIERKKFPVVKVGSPIYCANCGSKLNLSDSIFCIKCRHNYEEEEKATVDDVWELPNEPWEIPNIEALFTD